MIEPTRIIPAREASGGPDEPWEDSLDLFRPAGASTGPTPPREGGPDTQPLPRTAPPAARPAPPRTDPRAGARKGQPPQRSPRSTRALRVAVLTGTGGAAGFALALALFAPGVLHPRAPQGAAPAGPGAPTATAPGSPGAGLIGGVLRRGDTGPAVSELQARLLRIPDVYAGGAVDGRFDGRLAAAVARFQVWYGVRGDESGEYGDATRRDLESRTSLAAG